MIDYQATDRQGRQVLIKQLPDNRLVLVYQDGYMERREIMKTGLDKSANI